MNEKLQHKGFFYLDKEQDTVFPDAISVSYNRDWSDLKQSMKEMGILSPILVRQEKGGWEIISGKGRWLHSQEKKIPAFEVICDKKTALLTYIRENKDRGFNTVERALIILTLHRDFHMSVKDISQKYSKILGLPLGLKVISNHLDILQLPEKILHATSQGFISYQNAFRLLDFEKKEAEFLAWLFNIMHWNHNKQREILTLTWEISRKEDISVLKLFDQSEFRELWDTENPKANSDYFRSLLKERKFPYLQAYEDLFMGTIEDGDLDYPITIQHFSAFEKPDIDIKFKFKNITLYQKALSELEKLKKNGIIERLLKITQLETDS